MHFQVPATMMAVSGMRKHRSRLLLDRHTGKAVRHFVRVPVPLAGCRRQIGTRSKGEHSVFRGPSG